MPDVLLLHDVVGPRHLVPLHLAGDDALLEDVLPGTLLFHRRRAQHDYPGPAERTRGVVYGAVVYQQAEVGSCMVQRRKLMSCIQDIISLNILNIG